MKCHQPQTCSCHQPANAGQDFFDFKSQLLHISAARCLFILVNGLVGLETNTVLVPGKLGN